MIPSPTRYGYMESDDTDAMVVAFVSNAAKKFADQMPYKIHNQALLVALQKQLDSVVYIKQVKKEGNWRVLISFQGHPYVITMTSEFNVLTIEPKRSLSPTLQATLTQDMAVLARQGIC